MIALDLSSDYLVWDGTEGVQYESPRRSSFHRTDDLLLLQGPGAAAFHRVPRPRAGDLVFIQVAKRRAPTFKDLAGGVYTGQDLVWHLPAKVTSVTPQLGGRIIDKDQNEWTILEIALNKFKQTFRCITRQLILAFDLRDKIDLERAGVEYDASGAAVKHFPPDPRGAAIYSQLPARVQLMRQDVVDERGIRGFRGTHAVIVARQVDLTNEDRIKWSGQYLEIRGLHNPERLDELPVIDAELVP